jgi:hypothetical protein
MTATSARAGGERHADETRCRYRRRHKACHQACHQRPRRPSFYCDDAVVRIIDRNNPPSKPRVIKGKSAIGAFWEDTGM